MLADIKFNQEKVNEMVEKARKEYPDNNFSSFLDLENKYPKVSSDITGIYYGGRNFHIQIQEFSHSKIKKQFYSFSPETLEESRNFDKNKWRENYGVCNNYEQILRTYPELETSDKKFVVSMCKINESSQPSTGEYLCDEDDTKDIFLYHIYEIE